jgi:hypothetical protein
LIPKGRLSSNYCCLFHALFSFRKNFYFISLALILIKAAAKTYSSAVDETVVKTGLANGWTKKVKNLIP